MSLGRADLLLACPRDGATMEKVDVEGVKLDRCAACGGTWFDDAELRIVAGDRDLEKHVQRKQRFPAASGFACPRCRGACVKSYVGDVVVDTCTECKGVWLDRGELDEAKRQMKVRRATEMAAPGFVSFLARI